MSHFQDGGHDVISCRKVLRICPFVLLGNSPIAASAHHSLLHLQFIKDLLFLSTVPDP